MIRHIVLFKLKDSSSNNKERAKEVILSMHGKVATLKNLEAHTDFLSGPRSYDVILIADFETKEALDIYQNDDFHKSVVKKYFSEAAVSTVTVDYNF